MVAWRQVVIREKGKDVLQKVPYEISQDGQVRRISAGPSTYAGKILKPYFDKSQTDEWVSLSYQGRIEHWPVPLLLQEAWGKAGSPDAKEVEPLVLRRPQSEAHWNSRLSDADIGEIRKVYRATKKRYGLLRKLADKYGISRNHVWLIGNGHRWRHLQEGA